MDPQPRLDGEDIARQVEWYKGAGADRGEYRRSQCGRFDVHEVIAVPHRAHGIDTNQCKRSQRQCGDRLLPVPRLTETMP